MFRQLNQRIWGITLIAIVVLALAIIPGCEKSNTSSSSSSDSSSDVVLSTPTASPSTLTNGGTAVVEVQATDNQGSPLSGVSINFVASGGYFSPTTVVTNSSGIASSVFTANSVGTFSLVVQTSGVSKSVLVNVSNSAQQSSGNVDITINDNLLTADGTSSTSVTIDVADVNGVAAPAGTVVKLVVGELFNDIDGNGYFSAGIDSLIYDVNSNGSWDAMGVIPSVASTDANGQVTVTYTAGTSSGTAYLRATVTGTGDYDGYAQTSLTLTPDADVYAIDLVVDENAIQVAHTGGTEMTELHAYCYDVAGNRVPEGIDVNFLIVDAPDIPGVADSCNINGIGYGPVTVKTNSSGVATVQVWSGIRAGTVRMYASATGTAGTALSQATHVTVQAGPPYHISVGVAECNLQAWATVNEENGVVALVSDTFNNPVQNDVSVYFTSDEGVVGAHATTAEFSGVASQTWRSGEPWGDGIVWVIAETSGGTVKDSTYFINSHIPASVAMSVSPTSILADGRSKAIFSADVRDLNNNFVVDNSVKILTTYGAATQGSTTDGCLASTYMGDYTSGTLDKDNSLTGVDDDGIGAVEYITARVGFVSGSVALTLLTDDAYFDNCKITVESSAPYNTTNLPVKVLIKDRYGNPLGDHTLTISMSPAGTIVPGTATQETNAWGEAYGFRINAPAPPAPDLDGNIPDTKTIITITDSDPRGQIELTANITFKDE